MRREPKEVLPPPLYIDTFVRASRGIKLLPPSGIATCSRPRLDMHVHSVPTTGTLLYATANRKQRTSSFVARGSHLVLMSQRVCELHSALESEDNFLRFISSRTEITVFTFLSISGLAICMFICVSVCVCVSYYAAKGLTSLAPTCCARSHDGRRSRGRERRS